VVHFIRRRQHFAFVDVVDAEGFQHLRFHVMADPAFGHDRNRDRLHDFLDQVRVGHPGHAAGGANVRGYLLQRHDRHRAGGFRDPRLFGAHDVHDHAALLHLGHAAFHSRCSRFHVPCLPTF